MPSGLDDKAQVVVVSKLHSGLKVGFGLSKHAVFGEVRRYIPFVELFQIQSQFCLDLGKRNEGLQYAPSRCAGSRLADRQARTRRLSSLEPRNTLQI